MCRSRKTSASTKKLNSNSKFNRTRFSPNRARLSTEFEKTNLYNSSNNMNQKILKEPHLISPDKELPINSQKKCENTHEWKILIWRTLLIILTWIKIVGLQNRNFGKVWRRLKWKWLNKSLTNCGANWRHRNGLDYNSLRNLWYNIQIRWKDNNRK